MDDFPSNSRTPRGPLNKPSVDPSSEKVTEGPKLDPVITGKVVRRKPPLGRRIMSTFFSGDSNSVIGYLARDVLLPALQNLVTDFVTQGIEKAVYGETRTPSRTARGNTAPRAYHSYSGYSGVVQRSNQAPPPARRPVRDPSSVEIDDIIVETQFEATNIVDTLYETLQEYGVVKVAQLYELIGQTAMVTDHKWGWTNLDDLSARRVRGGYLLLIPPVESIR
jgi:hypothetical protein